jgi:hypothetical protein
VGHCSKRFATIDLSVGNVTLAYFICIQPQEQKAAQSVFLFPLSSLLIILPAISILLSEVHVV